MTLMPTLQVTDNDCELVGMVGLVREAFPKGTHTQSVKSRLLCHRATSPFM
jgi:hypothetical protein